MIQVLTWITIGWAALLLSSMVSMMAVFMGSVSTDLHGLLTFQLWLVPLQVAALVAYWLRAAQLSTGLSALWRLTPGWMVFTVASAAITVLIAELSFVLISLLSDRSQPWLAHVPAATAMLSALALAAGRAELQLEQRNHAVSD